MSISYRTRRGFRRFFKGLLIFLLAALVVWLCWVVWAGRFVLYTPQGAKLDFSLSQQYPEGELAVEPTMGSTVPVIYNEPETDQELPVVEQTPISGYYIDLEDLQTDIAAVMDKVHTLPPGTAVMLDMKNIKGAFYYSTSVGATQASDVDMDQMGKLLELLSTGDYYTIARIPAFRDWEFGLNNVPSGLPKKDGNGSLWMDDSNCYWLDPTSEDTLTYLIRITTELRSLGFDEVVYTDFRFPDTDGITFEADKSQALANAAATLVNACAKEQFFVSFFSTDYTFPLPQGSARLYLENVAAADVKTVAGQVSTNDPAIHLLFLTDVNDTRFNDYCVLRPL